MGKLILTLASNFYDLTRGVISQINEESDRENFLVVPDRFSLLAELEVFKQTQKDSLFNTSVLPISKLAIKMLETIGEKVELLTSEEENFLVRKAVEKSSHKFLCFSKEISPAFCEEIAKTIQQLKSSNVNYEQLYYEKSVQNGFDKKIHDTKLIFETYQLLLGDKKDSSDLLNLFNQKINQISELSTKNIYFAGFDSFTNQTYEIILSLKQICPLVVVGGYFPQSQKNAKIYETDIYNKFKKYLKDDNFEVVWAKEGLNLNQNHIVKNLFARKPEKLNENNYLKIYEAEDKLAEIDFVLKEIVSQIKKGAKFNQFAIACSSLSAYEKDIENKLKKYEINYYIDSSASLLDNALSQFVLNFLNVYIQNYEQNILFSIVNSAFVDYEKDEKADIINSIKKYALEKKENRQKFNGILNENINLKHFFETLESFEEKQKNLENFADYINFVNLILEKFNCKEKLEKIALQLKHKKEFKQEKICLQIFEKFVQTLGSISFLLKDEKTNLNDFCKTLKHSLEGKKVSTVPISGDCVFVGDATDSFFKEVETLYVLGCSSESLPKTLYDCGLINDGDISKLNLEISPTVKMINRRNKFKLFNLLTFAKQNLVISYPLSNEEGAKVGKAIFVDELAKIFDCQVVKIKNLRQNPLATQKEKLENIVFECANLKNAKNMFFKMVRKNESSNEEYDSLFELLKEENILNEQDLNKFNPSTTFAKIKNARKLFFPRNTVSVSQLQKYFQCPFGHFMEYGLKITETEDEKITPKEVGNLLHAFAEEFLIKYKNSLESDNQNQINTFLDDFFENAINDQRFYKFVLNQENKMIFKYLKFEAQNLANALVDQQTKSNFKTVELEKKIQLENFFQNNIGLSGKIDRIDEYLNYFRIIDYKTGNSSVNYKNVYLGEKIQLLIYAKAISKLIQKQCAGVFYFPVKNEFSEKYSFKMKGFFKKDTDIVLAMDKTLSPENNVSTVFDCKISGSKKNKESGNIELGKNGTENLENMIDYVVDLSNTAIKEILDGNIKPAPLSSDFEKYKYKNFFNFDLKTKEFVRKCNFSVDDEFFENYKPNEN